ncbi:MAG: mechanosensitive ion channel domain-containing protein [Pseudomonadota bacterium]
MWESLQSQFNYFAPKLLLAVVVLVVGWWAIGVAVRMLKLVLGKKDVDAGVVTFLSSLAGIGLKAALLVSVAGMIGIATTSFVALIGAAGLAVGLALQGSLANFAGGVLILLFKPFKVGDFIQAQDQMGTVREIQIFNTILKTPDNKTIIIPNGKLSNDSMVNFSTESTRRVDMVFGVGYGDDVDKVKATLEALVAADPRILKDPAHLVVLAELADSSVNFYVRVWAAAADYWGIYFDMHEAVKKTFDAKSISIPFPQMDIHKT